MLYKSLKKVKEGWKSIILCFLGCILLILGIGLFAAFIISLSQNVGEGMSLALSKDLLTPLIAVLVGGIALLAFFRDRDKIEFEKNENASKILYEQSKEALEHAYETLKAFPQNRVEWIYAATSIVQSDLLGQKIRSDNYKLSYQTIKNKYKQKLLNIFRENGGCIPAAFFFGYPEWKNQNLDLNTVKEETSNSVQMLSISKYRNEIIPDFEIKNFDLETVVVIMSFLKDENYFLDKKSKYKKNNNNFLDLVDVFTYVNWYEYDNLLFGARVYLDMQINPPPKEGSGGVEVTTLPRSSLPPDCLPDQAKHLVND